MIFITACHVVLLLPMDVYFFYRKYAVVTSLFNYLLTFFSLRNLTQFINQSINQFSQ